MHQENSKSSGGSGGSGPGLQTQARPPDHNQASRPVNILRLKCKISVPEIFAIAKIFRHVTAYVSCATTLVTVAHSIYPPHPYIYLATTSIQIKKLFRVHDNLPTY